MTKQELIAAMDAHDAEGERLEKAMAELGLDAKQVKALRKAEAVIAKAQATLAELMKEPEVAPAPERAKDETKTDETPVPETAAENKKGGK